MIKKYSTLLILSCFISIVLYAQEQAVTVKSDQNTDITNQYTFIKNKTLNNVGDQNYSVVSVTGNEDQLPAYGGQNMIPITVTINAGRSDLRLNGIIQFVKCSEGNEVIDGRFTTNQSSIIELPEGAYYICAWIPGNSSYSKTWFGTSTLCDSNANTCNSEIIPAASQFNTSAPNLNYKLLEYDKCGIFARSNIIVTILDQRASATVTGHPIRDVDVTLMKIPPARAFCPTLPPDGTVRTDYTFSRLNSSVYFLLLDIPDLPVRYDPCINLESGDNFRVNLIVRDDGIYRQ